MQTVQSPRDAPDKEGPLIKRGHVVKVPRNVFAYSLN
jgi:hypothetical protein